MQELQIDLDELAMHVAQGTVVPVVGRALHRVALAANAEVVFEDSLAATLIDDLKIPPDERTPTLRRLSEAWIARGGREHILHSKLLLAHQLAQVPVPRPIEQLAEMDTIPIYCTTAFDDTLKRAIARAGGRARARPAQITFSPRLAPTDIAPPVLRDGIVENPQVFHLFGVLTGLPTCALTDEDDLEYAHALVERKSALPHLFSLLRSSSLMFLGCGFPDWLGRFLLRVIRTEPWSTQRTGWELLADGPHPTEESFSFFLSRNGARVWNQGTSADLVAEIHTRWRARRTRDATPQIAGIDMAVEDPIFLSYASEDRSRVRELRQQLQASGLPVWMDESDLHGGEHFTNTIRACIERCAIFLPVISRHTQSTGPRFFWSEWNHAVDWLRHQPPSRQDWIRPLLLDGLPVGSLDLPAKFRELHITGASDGRIPDAFLQQAKDTIRQMRLARRGFLSS